ncbi:hypothetical protein [Flaviaesturariibacter aridisoli]|uniref:Nuclear transport factor 2 family protein n=1 Tax=Flaviaesturariibacter aridisoli TaxID=2545761 RepID=A0A4R4DTV6_9BACT|nr:hypothetical protein [Flaviaesturariibacter aridisoli]TCZ65198.1 hypothetical protein E0486_17630 [Flaviaesturariibacter aridisoli]
MKKTTLLLLTLCLLTAVRGNAQNLASAIKLQAMDMGTALMKNDFNTFVKYMHPNIIRFAGGPQQMKAKMDSAFNLSKAFNVTVKRYWIGNPGPIARYKDQLQAVLPQSTTVLTPMGELTVETSMIVISPDKGESWWFIDTNVYKADKLKGVLPDLSPELVIPPRKAPKMVPNKAMPAQ